MSGRRSGLGALRSSCGRLFSRMRVKVWLAYLIGFIRTKRQGTSVAAARRKSMLGCKKARMITSGKFKARVPQQIRAHPPGKASVESRLDRFLTNDQLEAAHTEPLHELSSNAGGCVA